MAWNVLGKFVERAIGAGVSRERIAQVLEDAGWKTAQVQSALDAYARADLPIAVPRPTVSATARELFLYLMLFSCLYMTIMALGTIMFQVINIYLPDPADSSMNSYAMLLGGVESRLRSGLSSLVIFLPAYVLLDFRIEALKRADPAQPLSNVRRKLTYLTLYVTVIVLLLDLSSLFSYWLNGELDRRVMLKGLTIAGLAALVLGRYLTEMVQDEHPLKRIAFRARALSLGVLVLAALIAMVLATQNIKSPGAERRRQADATREMALRLIDESVGTYYRIYGSLPRSLEDMERTQHRKFPRDPQTHRPYDYRVDSSRTYQLCSHFNGARTDEDVANEIGAYRYGGMISAFSLHPAGDHCFQLEVREPRSPGNNPGTISAPD